MLRKILVPIDGSPVAEQAIPVAISLARASRASLDFIRVHRPLTMLGVHRGEEVDRAAWAAEARYIDGIASETHATVDVPVSFSAPKGAPVELICARATDVGADLIVMTSHGRTGFSRAWLGSVADGVVRHSHVPVLMLRATQAGLRRPPAPTALRRILVPLDGSAFAREALQPGVALAQVEGGMLLLLRVVQPVPLTVMDTGDGSAPVAHDEEATELLEYEARRELAAVVRDLAAVGFTAVETHVTVEPGVANAVLEFATRQNVDAIAMSTHGRGASRLLVGSVADRVRRGSMLPILLQRPVACPTRLVSEEEIDEQLASVSGA
jgi:nucleotide-binding universal stress UspA family protein